MKSRDYHCSGRLLPVLLLWHVIASGYQCRAGVVEDWNEAVITAIKAETPPPAQAARCLAIVHLGVYRAVLAVDAEDGDLAAGSAAHESATVLFPAARGPFDTLLARGTAGRTPPGKEGVIHASREAARKLLQERAGDGSTTTVHYVPDATPGHWRRTSNQRPPETPQWGKVQPFLLTRGDQFRPPAPDLKSQDYASSWDEVRRLGELNSSERTADQTMLAKFWSDFSYTSTPPGHWNAVAREVALKEKLETCRSARLFALLNVAMSDSAIAMFDAKYRFDFWRPETAVLRADEDGNDETVSQAGWRPLLPCPPHPEYVSGHSTFSGAAAVVLSNFFPAEGLVFHARSDTVKDVVRTYHSFETCAREVGKSRVWGGIHFPMSCERGLELGKNVGRWVLDHFDKTTTTGAWNQKCQYSDDSRLVTVRNLSNP